MAATSPPTICYALAAITFFVLCHFIALILWIAPPYADMVQTKTESDHAAPIRAVERKIFAALRLSDEGIFKPWVHGYVDVVGMHQYWDFFAPAIPRVHRYLSVCPKILEDTEKPRIRCLDPRYQSFNGPIQDTVRLHHGQRSRSFRLVENLVRLQRPDFLSGFSAYWRKKTMDAPQDRIYLVLHEFRIDPHSDPEACFETRHDELIWVSPD